ncbi:MAG: hypothetical protein KME21_09760 [Desmonostoc vinosum HA7617-LM4]|jgi:hypothetical protein|nr:hypothetical protein [Desmonostoc vinosum HA7617-LM4]
MNLPLILDVALGLIFIYLIFSLLASEIQELIATVFQWRAEHLKKSIEILLAGDAEHSEETRVLELANKIYSNPLVRNINQEAKGFFVTLPRKLTWAIGSLYRSLKTALSRVDQKETAFGEKKHSAPSYIPADIFATTLMETLQLPALVQKLSEVRLEKFKNERLTEIENILLKLQEQTNYDEYFTTFFNTLFQEFAELRADFEQITWNFNQKKASLNTSIKRMSESLDRYLDIFQTSMPQSDLLEKTLRQLKFIRQDVFDDIEQAILLGGLRPNLNEVVESVKRGSAVYTEISEAIKDKDSETHKGFQNLIDSLPDSVVENIAVLSKRAQARIESTEEGILTLRREIENAFDSSMARASGVYKRNAKGVALLLGFGLALSANADTFHIISRLSKDTVLREALIYRAAEVAPQKSSNSDLDSIDPNQILNDVTLPIGWTEGHLKEQLGWQTLQIQGLPIFNFLTMLTGWMLTGIAIAMGAPFWFDLLGKIMNVRNAGRKPESPDKSKVE